MKSFEELKKEFENNIEINEAGKEAAAERKKRNKIMLILFLVIDAIIIFTLYKMLGFQVFAIGFYIFSIFFADIIILIIMLLIFNKKQNAFNGVFKEQVIKKMINNFFTDLEFYPSKQMPSQIYREGKYEGYDRYHSDDYIEAKINKKYLIDMAEVHTQREETYTDSDGHTHTRTYTIFHGMFAKIVMEKSINSDLRIAVNHAGYKNRLEMDSSEFEKYFDVFTSDKIKGMQLLTSDIMEDIIEFKNATNQHFDIFVNNNIVYLRFHCGTLFEPIMRKKRILDEKSLNMYYNILKFTYELSNKIIKIVEETEV